MQTDHTRRLLSHVSSSFVSSPKSQPQNHSANKNEIIPAHLKEWIAMTDNEIFMHLFDLIPQEKALLLSHVSTCVKKLEDLNTVTTNRLIAEAFHTAFMLVISKRPVPLSAIQPYFGAFATFPIMNHTRAVKSLLVEFSNETSLANRALQSFKILSLVAHSSLLAGAVYGGDLLAEKTGIPPYVLFTGVLILSATLNMLHVFESCCKHKNSYEFSINMASYAFAIGAFSAILAINAWDDGGILKPNPADISNSELAFAGVSAASTVGGMIFLGSSAKYYKESLEKLRTVFVMVTNKLSLAHHESPQFDV